MSLHRKILILGAGYHQIPAIQKAKQLGFYTIVFSNQKDDAGRNLADKFYEISTTDKTSVLRVAAAEQPVGILTIASEIAAPTVAFIAGQLSLPGYNSFQAETISNKFFLRSFLKKAGLTNLSFAPAHTLQEAAEAYRRMNGDVMLKPMLASGSRGIRRIRNAEELRKHFDHTLAESTVFKGVLLEEFAEGIHLGGGVLIRNNEIIFDFISEKRFNLSFVTTAHILPASISPEERSLVLDLLQGAVTHLKLREGVLDFDVVLTESGPEIIELGGRLGGNGISELVENHTGFDFIAAAIQIATGTTPEVFVRRSDPVSCFVIGASNEGILKEIKRFSAIFPEHKANLIEQREFYSAGSPVQPFTQGSCQLGILFVRDNNRDALVDLLDKIESTEWVTTV